MPAWATVPPSLPELGPLTLAEEMSAVLLLTALLLTSQASASASLTSLLILFGRREAGEGGSLMVGTGFPIYS